MVLTEVLYRPQFTNLDVLQGEDEYVEESVEHADSFHTTRPVPSSSAPQHTNHQYNAVSIMLILS